MFDERSLLGEKPEFNKPDKYLKSGKMTEHSGYIICENAKSINGKTCEDVAKEIVLFMNQNVPMNRNGQSNKKFRRTAEQIMTEKVRNGCCDSSTLFVALARAKGIPAMQIITVDVEEAKLLEETDKLVGRGHFYAGIYSQEDKKWYVVDPDNAKATQKSEIPYHQLKLNDRNFEHFRYGFAYVKDFSEVELNGRHIDSIENMGAIQRDVYKLFNKAQVVVPTNEQILYSTKGQMGRSKEELNRLHIKGKGADRNGR